MTKNFDGIVKKLSEDFNIAPLPKIPGTYNGTSLDWGRNATQPAGFKGDSFNTASSQIIFQLPAKKKKKNKSLDVRKKRVTTNRVGR